MTGMGARVAAVYAARDGRARVPLKPHAERISGAVVRLVAIMAAGAARANAGAAVARLMAIIRTKPARALIGGDAFASGDTNSASGQRAGAPPTPPSPLGHPLERLLEALN